MDIAVPGMNTSGIPPAAPVVKEKKPPTEAQLAKQKREKNAAERIFRETGKRLAPTWGARLLKLERESGNVRGFLENIRAGRVAATRKAKNTTAVAAPTAPAAPVAAMPEIAAPLIPKVEEAIVNAGMSLTAEEVDILAKCETIVEKLVAKTRKNLKNALGRNATAAEVKRLVNIRKKGTNISMPNFLKLGKTLRKAKVATMAKPNMETKINLIPNTGKNTGAMLEQF